MAQTTEASPTARLTSDRRARARTGVARRAAG